jgi:hypothetical protein
MLSAMRIADAQISFADAEMLAQGIELDPLLQKIPTSSMTMRN